MTRTPNRNTYKKILWTFCSTSVIDTTSFLMKFLWLLLSLIVIITTNQYSCVAANDTTTSMNELLLVQKIRVLQGGRYLEIEGTGFEKYPKLLFRPTNDTNICRTGNEAFEPLHTTDTSVLLAINNKTLPTIQETWIYLCYQDRPSGRLKHLGDKHKFMR